MEYSLHKKKYLSFAGARWQMNTTIYQNRVKTDQKTYKSGQIYIWSPMATGFIM